VETVRVLVADDSAVARRLVVDALAGEPGVRVVATASDGRELLALLPETDPDVVVLDVEMPGLDGLGVLRRLRTLRPDLPVVMFSVATRRGAEATLAALRNGAADCVEKPHATSRAEAQAQVAATLGPRVRALGRPPRVSGGFGFDLAPRVATTPRVVAVAASTGGPEALERLLGALPGDLPAPVLVVQHMPAVFTDRFAVRLDRMIALSVAEARDGDVPGPGTVRIAPGGRHLAVAADAGGAPRLVVHDGPAARACRPAADELFRSAASAFGPAALAVVLSGMGRDGLEGSRAVREGGGRVLAQDQASSVVWSMPGAVAGAGLAEAVDEPAALADRILAAVSAWEER